MHELERAAYEVEVYENYIEVLTSVHKDVGQDIDWQAILSSGVTPQEPQRDKFTASESSARTALENYKPSALDKLLKRSDSKREELSKAIGDAAEKDNKAYQEALREYRVEYAEWRAERELAERIIARDVNAYLEAITKLSPFAEIAELGTSLNFSIDDESDGSLMEVTLRVNDEAVIPKEIKSLLQSGKLSVKNMPKSQYYALYQDYVTGCVLRVARELFALLPLKVVIVTALGNILNSQTGYVEEKPILSIAIPRETLGRLNFQLLDPSDSLTNFVHKMSFKKTQGFAAVEALKASEYQLQGP
ncbi:MAG: hypothetical protein L0346_25795 [Chloroflexi bacterium]|nr:hypothetical protein [Chloroflexota bacterium]